MNNLGPFDVSEVGSVIQVCSRTIDRLLLCYCYNNKRTLFSWTVEPLSLFVCFFSFSFFVMFVILLANIFEVLRCIVVLLD